MFVRSEITPNGINLSLIESIGITQIGENQYEVRAWTPRGEWYCLAVFETKEKADQYIEMTCKEYNEFWRGR